MKRHRFTLPILFVLISIISAGMQKRACAQDEAFNLTLKQAIRMAFENNLDVKAELYNPASAEADIRKNKGIYDPLLSLLVNYQDSNPVSAAIDINSSIIRQRIFEYNAGVNQLIPIGGTVGLSFNNSWNGNGSGRSSLLNKYYYSELTLNYTQPLLKNFGMEATELNIDVAKYAKEGALEQFRSKLTDIITRVNNQYYNLYSLRKNLEVRKASLTLAETILKNSRAQVKAGVLPAMEILNAEFGVATQQKSLIDAERALRDQIDALRLLLQMHDATDIVPADTPFKDSYPIDEQQAIQQAIALRPEVRQLRITLKTSELQSRVARNLTLPDLSLSLSGTLTGLGSTYSKDLDRVGSGKYPIWSGGLVFTYPLGNRAAENDFIKSRLKVEQTKAQISSLEATIANDVRISVRAVKSGYLQLEVTARGRTYAEKVLEAYIKKQKVGLATTKDVLDVLNNLVTAQGNEIQAVTDYNNAVVALWKSTGELLDRENIRLTDKDADRLYENNR